MGIKFENLNIQTQDAIHLIIPGAPIAKKRPRFFRRGSFVGTYNAQETEEGRFLWEVKTQNTSQPKEGAVKLTMRFYFAPPKTTSKKRWKLMLDNIIKHIKKPDGSNLQKFLEDCLNGISWRDDSQIVEWHGYKYFDNNPR